MSRRLSAAVAFLIIGAAGLVAPAGNAQAARAAKIQLVTIQKDFVTQRCGTYKLSHVKAVLTGSTSANAKLVDKKFLTTLTAAQQLALESYNGLIDSGEECFTPRFKVTSTGSVYNKRYLSVAYTWKGDWYSASQDGVRSLNFDLKTRKSVNVTTFVSNTGKVFTWAACKALNAKAPDTGHGHDGQWSYCPNTERQRNLDGWTVDAGGVTVYGSGDLGLYKAKLSWSKLVKPSYLKSKKATTSKVSTTKCLGTPKATVTVQGGLVTVKVGNYAHSVYGIKPAGKKAGTKWRVVTEYANAAAADWWGPGYVEFASKSSNKAVKVSCFYKAAW